MYHEEELAETASNKAAAAKALGMDSEPPGVATARRITLRDKSIQFLAGAETVQFCKLRSKSFTKCKDRCDQ